MRSEVGHGSKMRPQFYNFLPLIALTLTQSLRERTMSSGHRDCQCPKYIPALQIYKMTLRYCLCKIKESYSTNITVLVIKVNSDWVGLKARSAADL